MGLSPSTLEEDPNHRSDDDDDASTNSRSHNAVPDTAAAPLVLDPEEEANQVSRLVAAVEDVWGPPLQQLPPIILPQDYPTTLLTSSQPEGEGAMMVELPETSEQQRAARTSLTDMASYAARALCPADLTDILCPGTEEITEVLLGTADDSHGMNTMATTNMNPRGAAVSTNETEEWSDPLSEVMPSASFVSIPAEPDPPDVPFHPTLSQNYEYMGRNISTLLWGQTSAAAVLALPQEGEDSPPQTTPNLKRGQGGGPNVVFSLLAREMTGSYSRVQLKCPVPEQLESCGGRTLYERLDGPAGGILSEVSSLSEALARNDWADTQTLVSRLATRLIGDPTSSTSNGIDDPSLPPFASRYHAGGGRIGLERDAFCQGGGVEVLMRVFLEPTSDGTNSQSTWKDARDISPDLVATKLSGCWTEVLVTLRELVYALPHLVEQAGMASGGFLSFLFTLLSHTPVFDATAALIEEILSLLSLSAAPPLEESSSGRVTTPSTTFFLGNIPHLYELWAGFSCRQLAHFCRLLAFLVFEPEDRQVLESSAVLKSMELLQLRRDRAVRAGRDATVDMNQAILFGDKEIMKRLLTLLRVMNYAPSLKRRSAYHVMAHFPFVADTLGMVGLTEIRDWGSIGRLDRLARSLATTEAGEHVSELGKITDMLESLSGLLQGDPLEPANQLGHIIHVINAAQQAGVVVGRQRNGRAAQSADRAFQGGESASNSDIPSRALGEIDTIVSSWPALSYASNNNNVENTTTPTVRVVGIGIEEGQNGSYVHHLHTGGSPRARINTPQDAANEMQFNALILAPYQIEVLFILCTLMGGRRKIDMQVFLTDHGLIDTLGEMFHRLTLGASNHTSGQASAGTGESARPVDSIEESGHSEHTHGIHGQGCDCTAESALSVQYLRLLHNFCDRDCDNYLARRLLLSASERQHMFSPPHELDLVEIEHKPGLLSQLMKTFIDEADDSPYRFWLASCIESYLRGSSSEEQLFAANSGLLAHLVEDVISDRLHCAGSLQTSFDLLGELCKGNAEVLRILMSGLDEDRFRRLMGVAASNLVDSNVFFRSLLLTVERMSVTAETSTSSSDGQDSRFVQDCDRAYLTHSWWDSQMLSSSHTHVSGNAKDTAFDVERKIDDARPSDWYPASCSFYSSEPTNDMHEAVGSSISSGPMRYGWIYSPSEDSSVSSWRQSDLMLAPNTIERLSWFLSTNRARMLRDLLGVVDLRNINHENICCLNTAVVVTILAHRRNELSHLLDEIRGMYEHEKTESRERVKNAMDYHKFNRNGNDRALDETLTHAMKQVDLEDGHGVQSWDHSLLSSGRSSSASMHSERIPGDALRNFRELLWFWSEYYSHRGRDRLSLEFSSRLRFHEWKNVVASLTADDASPNSLVRNAVRLPRSPYDCSSHLAESPTRAI